MSHTKESIRSLLEQNDEAVRRALLVLFEHQTQSEQATESTTEHNKIGFSALDAEILSSFAKQIIRWNGSRDRRHPSALSTKQMTIARRRVLKYSGQLAKIANARAAA